MTTAPRRRTKAGRGLLWAAYRQQGGACFYCTRALRMDRPTRRRPENAATADHLYPVSTGGTNSFTNVVAACRDCNRAKGARMPTDEELARKAALMATRPQPTPPANTALPTRRPTP